jgi:broad specificity phosphatase PhoE
MTWRVNPQREQMNLATMLDTEHTLNKPVQLWLVRHGETQWSATGQHTGRTDLPLTIEGKRDARQIGGFLDGRCFALVLTSPLQRARETCRLAGYGESAIIEANLGEWDYGKYEGRTTPEIQIERPDWSLWRDGVIGDERIEQVAARAQKVIDRAVASSGDVLVFAHGHILRVLTVCWLGLPPDAGRLFALGRASVSVLGYERYTRVITQWNGEAKEQAHSRSEVKMASAERSNQNAAPGGESEQPALSSENSAGDLDLSGADTGSRK